MERIVHVDDMPGIAAATLAVLRGDSTGYSIEHRVRARSGDWRWISSRGQVIERDADGRALRMSGVNFDITARKWIEHSLQDSEEQLRIALAAADMSAWRWDIATGRFNWPMAPHALLGSPVESNFPDFRELVHPQDRAGFRKAWVDALEGTGDFSTEFRIVRTDGEERWVNARGRLHRYETGAPDHLFGVIWDVTERHRAYDALEQSEARFRDLVDLSSDWYWEQDAENRFRDISTGSRARAPQREGVLGLTRLEIPGSLMSDQMRAEHERIYAAREPFKELQYPMRLPDGTVQHISVSGKPIYDGVGTFVGYRGVGRDVSAWMQAAQSVHDSREQLLRVIDTMFEGVVVYDAEGRIILINRAAERVLGVPRHQAIGLNIDTVPWRRLDVSGGSFEPSRLAWTVLRDTPMLSVATEQHMIVAPNGRRSTIQRNAARLTQQDGTFGGVVITFEDITDRLRADERSRMLIEASLDGYCAMNALGEVETTNLALVQMTGCGPNALAGRAFADLWLAEERSSARRAIEQAVAQGNARFAGRIARSNDAICDAEAGITYVDIDGGRMHAFFRDVTERNAATRRVEESERIYRTLFQHSPVGIAFVDTDGIIREASATMARMAGVEGPQELIGTRADDWVVPEERPDARRRRQMAIAGDSLLPFVERCLVRSDGTRMLTEMVAAPISVEGRQMAVVIGRDISERKKYEWTLLAAKDALEARVAMRTQELTEANRELEAFVYTVSHDLRAPLRFIGGHARLLHEHLGQLVTPRAAELLGGIESGSERLSMLIEGLLEFSRLGRQPLNRRKVELRSLVEEVLAAAAPASGRCEVCVGELPTASIDPVLVKQVFANLVSNAFKYTSRRRSPRIEIGCETQQGQPVLFVRDNGVGFSIRYVDKAFEAFQRLHPESRFPGVGVGLAIVKRIVERHGGRVWAEAKVGKGATFRFTLGLADAGEP
jgi:PAS domain S-box-containing protein